MADAEEPQFSTLKERIAALNQQKTAAGAQTFRKPPPPPPPGRSAASETRSQTAPAVPTVTESASQSNDVAQRTTPALPQRPSKPKQAPPPLPRRDTQNSQPETPQEERRAPPPLPSRTPSAQSTPGLPRRTSTLTPQQSLNERRGSASSEVSQRSTGSSLSQAHTISSVTSHGSDGRRVPPAFNQASLPPLLPTRREREAKAQEEAAREATKSKPPLPSVKSAPSVNGTPATQPAKPGLPPRLPARPGARQQSTNNDENSSTTRDQESHSKPVNTALKAAHITGFGSGKARPKQQALQQENGDNPPPLPSNSRDDDTPPPVPVASRPSAAEIEAASARASERGQAKDDCWVCRDWSGPDGVAAQFPRQTLPRNDPVGHLAHGLCSPFPSYTDKARAIFTWFHHNIFYDTVSFFGNCVKHMSVEDTIFSGKAVCQGYAETYKAIANRAGLDCIVVGGHGKGYGHSPLKQGERPPPPKPDGHAWNAVRIDGGVWKLLDACWGAGHLDSGTNQYKQEFSPKQFTRTNEEFGESHFPKDSKNQFRNDGRTLSWEEYFIGPFPPERPIIYTNANEEGILDRSVEPREKHIPVHSGQVVRFQFSKICEHWRSETHGKGKPPLLLLSIHGVDGRKDEMIPFETDGYWHWIDVHARDLGAPGQSVQVAHLTSINGQDARGASAREYFSKKGKVGMGWSFVMKWDLV